MSDTPRVDKFWHDVRKGSLAEELPAIYDFARQLERELAQAERGRMALRDLHDEHCRHIAVLDRALAAAERPRDTDDLMPFAHMYRLDGVCLKHETYRCEACRAARAALQAGKEPR